MKVKFLVIAKTPNQVVSFVAAFRSVLTLCEQYNVKVASPGGKHVLWAEKSPDRLLALDDHQMVQLSDVGHYGARIVASLEMRCDIVDALAFLASVGKKGADVSMFMEGTDVDAPADVSEFGFPRFGRTD